MRVVRSTKRRGKKKNDTIGAGDEYNEQNDAGNAYGIMKILSYVSIGMESALMLWG